MDWKVLLASITAAVDQALLLRHEYLVPENRILRNQIKGHMRLSDGERKTMADMRKKLGKQAPAEVASIVTPNTIRLLPTSPRESRFAMAYSHP